MDGKSVGPSYYHTPLATTDYEYNVPVYSVAGLENQQHTFVLTPTPGDKSSLVLFDYAVYTHDDGVPDSTASASVSSVASSATSPVSNKRSSDVGAIIGGVVGGVSALIVASLLIFCLRRRRRRAAEARAYEKTFILDPESWMSLPPVAPVTTGGSPSKKQRTMHPETSTATVLDTLGPGRPKAAIRQIALLERQLAEMQHQIDVLHLSGSRTHTPGSAEVVSESAVLRAQVDALKKEVERLRTENAPPAYVGERPALDDVNEDAGALNEHSDGSASGGRIVSGKRARRAGLR